MPHPISRGKAKTNPRHKSICAERFVTASLGTLHFLPGETRKNFSIRIKTDHESEGSETLHLRLVSVKGGEVGPRREATLAILDR